MSEDYGAPISKSRPPGPETISNGKPIEGGVETTIGELMDQANMTTKDWQAEVDAAAEKLAHKRWGTEYQYYDAVLRDKDVFRAAVSWAREKLENKIAILESRASQFESTIKATLAREEKLVRALEFYAKEETWLRASFNDELDHIHLNEFLKPNWAEIVDDSGKTARAALKTWRGEK